MILLTNLSATIVTSLLVGTLNAFNPASDVLIKMKTPVVALNKMTVSNNGDEKSLTIDLQNENHLYPDTQRRVRLEKKPGKNVKILSRKFKSVKEILSEFKGRKVLIDLWASWCPACLDEFKGRDSLYAYAKSKNIAVLYISFDEDKNEKDWRRDLQRFYLPGYHIRAVQALRDDITTMIWGGVDAYSLPHYMLADEKGMIVDKAGTNREVNETLYEYLERKLGL